MKKTIAIILCLLLALCSFAACGNEKEETLIVYLNAEFPPFEYYDEGGQIVGVDVDIANAIGEKLGMKVEIKDVAFESICIGLTEDNACGISGITINEERKKNVDFTSTYFISQQAIIYKEGALTPVNGVISTDVLIGKKVGVQTGTTGDFLVQDVCGEDAPKQYSSALVATQDIGSGCDYVVIDSVVAKNIVANNAGLEYADLDAEEEPLGIAVKKGNTELLNKLETALQELIADGKIDEFMVKHSK